MGSAVYWAVKEHPDTQQRNSTPSQGLPSATSSRIPWLQCQATPPLLPSTTISAARNHSYFMDFDANADSISLSGWAFSWQLHMDLCLHRDYPPLMIFLPRAVAVKTETAFLTSAFTNTTHSCSCLSLFYTHNDQLRRLKTEVSQVIHLGCL